MNAQDKIKSKEQETGQEPLLTDLINEDVIADMTKKLNEEDFDVYERFRKETGAQPPTEAATEE